MRGRPFKKGHIPWHAGKNIAPMTGKKHSQETKNKQKLSKIGKNNHRWNGGICMRHGYIYLLKPKHPNCNAEGYVAKHRLVMERKIGRYLTKKEHIHHINENKLDNRIINLLIVTNKEHMDIHRKKITEAMKRRKNEKSI